MSRIVLLCCDVCGEERTDWPEGNDMPEGWTTVRVFQDTFEVGPKCLHTPMSRFQELAAERRERDRQKQEERQKKVLF